MFRVCLGLDYNAFTVWIDDWIIDLGICLDCVTTTCLRCSSIIGRDSLNRLVARSLEIGFR